MFFSEDASPPSGTTNLTFGRQKLFLIDLLGGAAPQVRFSSLTCSCRRNPVSARFRRLEPSHPSYALFFPPSTSASALDRSRWLPEALRETDHAGACDH